MIRYELPNNWIQYDPTAIVPELAEAKAAILSLKAIPYQRSWVEALQKIELKREVAGTSRIEGAEFTERELELALGETPEQLLTRSQRQAHAAMQTYRWIAAVPNDRPISSDLISDIHRRIVTGADDDHCPPGQLRRLDENVNFGQPRHRGVEGGDECGKTFDAFAAALQRQYKDHDVLIQALAAHYHFAAMHPFLDGNGRTARALEALMLQRANLRDTCFIAMSNYYYDEKTAYLAVLSATRAAGHDLTQFLKFGLRGIALQSKRLLAEIRLQVEKALFRNMMFDLFNRLKTPKKRVIAERQVEILKILLDTGSVELEELTKKTADHYKSLGNPTKALYRDVNDLIALKALRVEKVADGRFRVHIRLEWPTEITETEFFARVKNLPKAKTHSFLQ